MAVDWPLWWSIWLPRVLVWGATALALLTALVTAWLMWRARHRYAESSISPGIMLYLHGDSVLEIVRSGSFGKAVDKEVRDVTGSAPESRPSVVTTKLGAPGGRTSSRERTETYVKSADPVELIGVVLRGLTAVSGIVRADLTAGTITRSDALSQTLGPGHPDRVRLQDIDTYVLVKGRFRLVDTKNGRTTLTAPYGQGGAHVRLDCHTSSLRHEDIPPDAFKARVLGRVQSWDAARSELLLRPIALFQ
ncbi:hypothetical protein ACOBQX_00570 [Actinokineospora sp. G85]|uniref:hypothetical protein n=1 Tax=Actinokineospora sp. G85 TaxID=3406626 RepID=UPI003C726D8E